MSSGVADWVWLARVRKPQGRKGEVFAEILTDFPEKFAERKRLWLLAEDRDSTPVAGQPPTAGRNRSLVKGHDFSRADKAQQNVRALAPAPREVELVHHWLHKGGIVLHFAGIDSISAAETLAGLVVAIPRSERATLVDDEVHIADLIGCTLVDVAVDPPASIGTIENVDRTAGPVPLLIVKGPKSEVLVPFAKSYLRKVDVENQRIEMALPEGLADLNV
jgi:16S rRNA processing protein RimM